MRTRSAVLALLVGCVPAVSEDPRPTVRAPRVQTVVPSPRVPRDRTAFAPSQIELAGSVDGTTLSENESCAGCHADAAAQWRAVEAGLFFRRRARGVEAAEQRAVARDGVCVAGGYLMKEDDATDGARRTRQGGVGDRTLRRHCCYWVRADGLPRTGDDAATGGRNRLWPTGPELGWPGSLWRSLHLDQLSSRRLRRYACRLNHRPAARKSFRSTTPSHPRPSGC